MSYYTMFRDRNGEESRVGESHRFKGNADNAIVRIGEAQRDLGATHVSHGAGLSRASWPDDSYIEAWREWEPGSE